MKATRYVELQQRVIADSQNGPPLARRGRIGSGYVYIAVFRSGLIKVGRTIDPVGRLASHDARVATHGDAITRYWVSARHLGYEKSERHLIKFCNTHGMAVGTEWFRDLSAAAVLAFAVLLLRNAERGAYLAELIDAAEGDLSMTWQEASDRLPGDGTDNELAGTG